MSTFINNRIINQSNFNSEIKNIEDGFSFVNVIFENVSFKEVKNKKIIFENCNFIFSFFTFDILNCKFINCSFDQCNFFYAILNQGNFSENTLWNNCFFKGGILETVNGYHTFSACRFSVLTLFFSNATLEESRFYICDCHFNKENNVTQCKFEHSEIMQNEPIRYNYCYFDYNCIEVTSSCEYRECIFYCNSVIANPIQVKNINCKSIQFIPQDTELIGWKKAFNNEGAVLVKLRIPADAKRTGGENFKCRCDKAEVLDIFSLTDNRKHYNSCHSGYNPHFKYVVGEVVESEYDENSIVTCSKGIHFFLDKNLAIDY